MTRFARAKGSKSSNERTPDDSTPWEVMKEQLLQSKKEKEEAGKRQEAENQRIANYEKFLKDHKISKRKATWCDFPEEQAKKRLLPLKQSAESNKNEQSNVNVESNATSQADSTEPKNKKKKKNEQSKIKGKLNVTYQMDSTENKNDKKQKNEQSNIIGDSSGTSQEKSTETKNKKKKNKNKLIADNAATGSAQNVAAVQLVEGAAGTAKKQKKKIKKKQKINSNENAPQADNVSEPNNVDPQTSPNKNHQNKNNGDGANKNMNKKKKGKMANGKPVRRKEINDQSFQLIINTKEVELVRFEGFPIMKKDAERLTELRQSMIKKGIPKSEVQRTMKLERRRAEKALARLKREVCYNCRKGGHNLSDCPELKSKIPGVDAADGVCFKCGSTEHRQFECKVQRDKEFRFATCFICREPGHIARQCPDNPKGLYPNGGSCKLCGDVTHLRKDCPTTQGQREETSVKLDTLESADNIEDISHLTKPANSVESEKKQPKKIKF